MSVIQMLAVIVTNDKRTTEMKRIITFLTLTFFALTACNEKKQKLIKWKQQWQTN